MEAKHTVLFIFSLVIFAWIGLVQAQEAKMVKLPNGEEVVDINGEWDTLIENYGPYSEWGNVNNIIAIKLEGNSFVGVRMKSTNWYPEGSEAFRGELDKDGMKKVQLKAGGGTINVEGQISNDGKTIILDDGEMIRLTMTRK